MNKKRTLKQVVSLALCLTLTFRVSGWLFPAAAMGVSSTVYTFGDANAPFRDLAKEHEEEVKQREKARKKAAQKQAIQEKAAMRKAAREAREREKRDKAAKEDAEKGANQT